MQSIIELNFRDTSLLTVGKNYHGFINEMNLCDIQLGTSLSTFVKNIKTTIKELEYIKCQASNSM